MFLEFIIIGTILSIILFCTDKFYYNNDTGGAFIKSILFFFLSIGLAYLISYLYGQPPINQIKKKDDKKDDNALKNADKNVLKALQSDLENTGKSITGSFQGGENFMTSMTNYLVQENP